jgi:hypothetical protein
MLSQICVALVLVLSVCTSCHGRCDSEHTPGGPVARECVHEVPSGATVSTDAAGNTVVTLNGKVVATYPPCPCASDGVGPSPGTRPPIEVGGSGGAGAGGAADG